MSLFCGIFTLFLLFSRFAHGLDYSDIFLLPIVALLSIATNYFGIKTIFNSHQFIQLELQDKQLKYLLVGKGRGAGLNYFFSPSFDSIEYENIKNVTLVKVDLFDKRIQILKKDNSAILLPFLYNDIVELEDIINEIKKRIK